MSTRKASVGWGACPRQPERSMGGLAGRETLWPESLQRMQKEDDSNEGQNQKSRYGSGQAHPVKARHGLSQAVFPQEPRGKKTGDEETAIEAQYCGVYPFRLVVEAHQPQNRQRQRIDQQSARLVMTALEIAKALLQIGLSHRGIGRRGWQPAHFRGDHW